VLNRLFIIVGLIAILALAAAFVVPNYIEWGDYRDRLQAMASETVGAPVAITGDIKFSLLPQPQLNFSKVVVGTAERPVMTVESVEAQFSLVDFFRDRYALTKLELNQPVIDLRVTQAGGLDAGITLAEQVSATNVSAASAQIIDGMVRLADGRSGETFAVGNVDGEFRIEAVRGPFAFQGTGEMGGAGYGLRVATTVLQTDGATKLTAFIRPSDERFSLSAEGVLQTGGAPSFTGTMTYRQAPRKPAADQPVDAGKGHLVVASKVEANAERVLLSDYTVTPDENRAATRLLGAAEITLGAKPSFNAVISGTTLALPHRDATVENIVTPYELVRLLAELPLPPDPGFPGTVGVDIAEMDLRAVTLRNVRLDAEARDDGWRVNGFSAQLPGGTALSLTGALDTLDGRPNFSGKVVLRSQRLDVLAQLWRKPVEGNPLFGMPGSFAADVALVGETLSLSNGVFSLDEATHAVSAEIGFGSTGRHLNVEARFAVLSAEDSAALAALLPAMDDDGAFALTFPKGAFDIALPGAVINGLAGTNLVARGSWEGGVVVADKVAADDLGGATFDARLTAFGSFAKPEVSGVASVQMLSAQSPALARIFDLIKAPQGVRDLLGRSLPADLSLRLDAPSGEGGQELAITGKAATADLRLDAKLGAGFLRALSGPLSFNLDLRSDDATAMTEQLGLGGLSLTPDDQPMHAVAIVEGTPSNSLEATLRVEGGADSIGFSGNLVVLDPEKITGNGTVKVALSDFAALTDSLGAGGIDVPAVTGNAHVEFIGASSLLLEGISASSGGQPVTGSLSLSEVGGVRTTTGQLTVGRFDPSALLSVLVGRQAALRLSDATWPDGPFSTGVKPRTTSGRISVTAPLIMVGDTEVVTDAKFDFDWDATNTRIRQFAGTMGGGQVTLDVGVCCAGPLPDKQVTGRMTLTNVALDAMVPPKVADALTGKIDGAAQFDATGGDLQSVLGVMTGQGSYTIRDFRIERFDPGTFAAAAALENVLDADADVLTASVVETLDDGPFVAKPLSGSFTIAGGVIRSPNLAIEGDVARLFGSTSVSLSDLAVGGGFVMSPTVAADPSALISESTAQIAASLGGTLAEPERVFDAAGMIDAMKARALELEVARLEKLQAEDEARQKAAAEERARIAAEEERKRVAEEAARKAAEDAAAKVRAEEEARRRAEEERLRRERQQQQQRSTDIVGPLDLGIN
jgi:hypothetical protein